MTNGYKVPPGLEAVRKGLREYEKHTPDSPLYMGPKLRLCPACPDGANIHPTSSFFYNSNSKICAHTTLCRECLAREEEKEQQADEMQAVNVVTSALAKATRARRTEKVSFGDMLPVVCAGIGGVDNAFKLTGKVLGKSLRNGLKKTASTGEMNLAVKAAGTLLASAAAADKGKQPIDLSDLTEEELRDILMEPARQLLLNDEGFRKLLLADTAVREAFLRDCGVTVIEATDDGPDGEPI